VAGNRQVGQMKKRFTEEQIIGILREVERTRAGPGISK
jgi:DNA-binding TFAR19-related protein (PDSD5 family)